MNKEIVNFEVEQSFDSYLSIQYSRTRITDANGTRPGEPICSIYLEDAVEDDKWVIANLNVIQIDKFIHQLNQVKELLLNANE